MTENVPDESKNDDSGSMIMILVRMLLLGALIFLILAAVVLYLHDTHMNSLLEWLYAKIPSMMKLLDTKHQYL